MHAIAMACSVE